MRKIILGATLISVMASCGSVNNEVCQCAELSLTMMKEIKAAGNSVEAIAKINEKHKGESEKCNALNKKMEEEMGKLSPEEAAAKQKEMEGSCAAFQEMQDLIKSSINEAKAPVVEDIEAVEEETEQSYGLGSYSVTEFLETYKGDKASLKGTEVTVHGYYSNCNSVYAAGDSQKREKISLSLYPTKECNFKDNVVTIEVYKDDALFEKILNLKQYSSIEMSAIVTGKESFGNPMLIDGLLNE